MVFVYICINKTKNMNTFPIPEEHKAPKDSNFYSVFESFNSKIDISLQVLKDDPKQAKKFRKNMRDFIILLSEMLFTLEEILDDPEELAKGVNPEYTELEIKHIHFLIARCNSLVHKHLNNIKMDDLTTQVLQVIEDRKHKK